jgi:uncharacterized protein (DUF362 family)
MFSNVVEVIQVPDYFSDISEVLPETIFSIIKPGNKVIIKPNWIRESHLSRPDEWEQVITHPAVITSVLKKVLEKLNGTGKVSIVDGPETSSSFEKILAHYPVQLWKKMADESGIMFEILDLREDEWITDDNVVVERKKLPGDPLGSTQVNLLNDTSEFFTHSPSKKGYFGADSNISETNKAHDGRNNYYRVSRTVIESDIFINIPKLKTHKKAGITCNLKNLVGINTYKNFLPHNTIGTASDGGDQFPGKNSKSKIESKLMPFIHQHILTKPGWSRLFSPVIGFGRKIFGDNSKTIRGGSWYGNDTLWRTILDLNKILFYADPDGSMRADRWSSTKKYISVVDAIIAGEGNGPKSPDPVHFKYLICGTNPVATDTVCAAFMGFDAFKIPHISKAYLIKKYRLVNFNEDQIEILFSGKKYHIGDIPAEKIRPFIAHFGWTGHIEK